MSDYTETVNVIAGLAGNTDSFNTLQNALASGEVLEATSSSGTILATIASVIEEPVTAVVAGSDAAALNVVQIGVVLSSRNPLSGEHLAELSADGLSALGNVAIVAGALGATAVLSPEGVTVAAIGTGAQIVINNYEAIATAASTLLSDAGKVVTNIFPVNTYYSNPDVTVDGTATSGTITLDGTNSEVNLGVGFSITNTGPTNSVSVDYGYPLGNGQTVTGGTSGSVEGGGGVVGLPAGSDLGMEGSFSESDGFAAKLQTATNRTLAAKPSNSLDAAALRSANASKNGTTTPSGAFEGPKWAHGATVTYDSPSAITGVALIEVKAAIATIGLVTGLNFKAVSTGAELSFQYSDLNTAATGLVGTTTFASLNGALKSAHITLENPGQEPTSATGTFVYQDALHELGHAVGLAENADPHSIMYYALGTSNPTLDATDLKNLATLYGPAGDAIGTELQAILNALPGPHQS